MTRSIRLALIAFAAPAIVSAANFPVTTTSDGGTGSLREAILSANSTPGADYIGFGIPGSGVHRIGVTSPLPPITEAVIIDGFTQPGSDLNTDPIGNNAVLLIEVAGSGGFMNGLVIQAGPTTIRGLAIFDFFGAIVIDSPTGPNRVESNFIGVDAAGSAMGNVAGVAMSGNSLDTIGGLDPGVRNVISASLIGVQVDSGHNKRILGNHIGMDLTGTASLGNEVGVWVRDSSASIGEADPAARNVISGNLGSGVRISGESNASVTGNYIGPDATGFAALGNGGRGVESEGSGVTTIHDNVISGNGSDGISLGAFVSASVHLNHIGTDPVGISGMGNSGAGILVDSSACLIGDAFDGGNVIAYNQAGVWIVLPGLPLYSIRANSIYSNGGLGIVSGPTPVIRPNAAGSLDNFPLIISVTSDDTNTTVQGVYRGAPNCPVGIDFFSSPICSRRPRDFEEGETYLGSEDGQSDAGGEFAFNVTLPVSLEDERVTATATAGPCPPSFSPEGADADPKQTSQFSQRLPFSIDPSSGPPAGALITIHGTDFLPGAVVDIGDIPAGNVTVVGPTEIQVTAPALPAGSANNVVVTNLDGTAGGLTLAWVVDFLDVPPSHQFHDFVTAVVSNGIAVGTGGGNYGVEAATLRKQMAVFLLKAKHGLCYPATGCSGVFADVPCTSPFAPWIELLAAEGITGGCGGSNFCPDNPVTRAQMATFLLKAEHGSAYAPPACAGVFGDVACPSPFADWIEQLAAEGITSGCGGGNYCPQSPNTRGQMAVFLTRTFDLQ